MTFREATNALRILRSSDLLEKAGGVLEGASKIYKALSHGAGEAGKKLTESGHPLLGGVVSSAPALGVGYAGYKAYQSQPVQEAIYRHQMRKAQRQAMGY